MHVCSETFFRLRGTGQRKTICKGIWKWFATSRDADPLLPRYDRDFEGNYFKIISVAKLRSYEEWNF